MVPREFSKVWCYIAALITLVEAVVWGAISIYAIGVYQCAWQYIGQEKNVSTWSMLHITYLMGKCSGEAGASPYVFVPPSLVATNFQVWMWIYAVISAAWIPACVLLIVAALSEVKGNHGAMLYYPWIGFTSSFVVLDLIGAVYHLVGVFNTTTPDNYASFTAGKTWNDLTNSHSHSDITTWLPSLYITLYFCRLLVIWIVNIALAIIVYRASCAVASHQDKHAINNETERSANEELNEPVENRPRSAADSNRYRLDEFGIPIEEMSAESAHYQREAPAQRRMDVTAFEINSRHRGTDSFGERWHESTPPIASGVRVPPELNKFEPFSYMAGDQPQQKRNAVSRSNSARREYPPIPRPDYTVADRRSAPVPLLELVPNRFRVPNPELSAEPGSSPRTPRSGKIPPAVPPKTRLHMDRELVPDIRYITPRPASPLSKQLVYSRRNSQGSSYNLTKIR